MDIILFILIVILAVFPLTLLIKVLITAYKPHKKESHNERNSSRRCNNRNS